MAFELVLLALLFFLPGYLLTNSVFPRRGSLGGSLDPLYRVFVAVLLSVSLAVVVGSALVILGESMGLVLFRPSYLWPGLLVISVAFFLLGVVRGAYPRLSKALGRVVPASEDRPPVDTRLFSRLEEVAAELEEARRRAAIAPEEAGVMRRRIAELEEEKARLEEEASKLW